MRPSQITEWCHAIIESLAEREGLYVDATMGKGSDTSFLCRLAGEKGQVLAFDIQEEALRITKERLEKEGMTGRAQLLLCGHEHMEEYIPKESVDVICFNFGYLPGADHKIATKASTSISAIRQGLALLKKGGMMSLCIYSGGDTGFEEKEAILNEIHALSSKEYTVIVNNYFNRENNPPMPVFIFKS